MAIGLFKQDIRLFPLRPRQVRALDGIRAAIRAGHKRIILQAPCRSGKTVISAHIIAGALAKNHLPLFSAPRISLIGQTIERFESQGITDIGVIQANHPRTNAQASVQIASIQTLVDRPLPDVDIVIIDEVHIQHRKLDKILDSDAWRDKIVIGLSATPWRRGMGHRWTSLVLFGSVLELIDEGWLCPVIAYGVPDGFTPNRAQLHTASSGDFVEAECESEMSKATIVGNIVETWKKHGPEGTGEHPGDRTFMFCVNRAHAKLMQQKFEAEGIPCGYIDGTMDAEEREAVFAKYRTREYKVIASIDTIGTGIDEDVRCVIYARLTKSEIRWVQDGSRGMTPAAGKTHMLLLDHAGTCEELGIFTDIHHETLDTRAPGDRTDPFAGEKKKQKPFKCPHCNVIIPYGRTMCPICHAILKTSKVRHVDGELIEFRSSKKKPAPEDKQAWYSGFLAIAQERGHSEGWAAYRYKEKFGVWPRGVERVPRKPTPEMVKYDRHLRIRYIKGREKEQAVNA